MTMNAKALGRADAEAILGKGTAMKAWSVIVDPEEGASIIVWAETRGKAKTSAMKETDYDMDYVDIRPRRAKWADGYSDMDDIPTEVYLENGWCWPCSECDCMMFKGDIGGYVDGEPVCTECWGEIGGGE